MCRGHHCIDDDEWQIDGEADLKGGAQLTGVLLNIVGLDHGTFERLAEGRLADFGCRRRQYRRNCLASCIRLMAAQGG